jgi:hypothetical protein
MLEPFTIFIARNGDLSTFMGTCMLEFTAITEITDHAHATLEDCSHSVSAFRRVQTYRQDPSGAYHSSDWFQAASPEAVDVYECIACDQ